MKGVKAEIERKAEELQRLCRENEVPMLVVAETAEDEFLYGVVANSEIDFYHLMINQVNNISANTGVSAEKILDTMVKAVNFIKEWDEKKGVVK